jgi:hypothetical protein
VVRGQDTPAQEVLAMRFRTAILLAAHNAARFLRLGNDH